MTLVGELIVQPRRFPTSWESQQLPKVRRSTRTIFKVANMSAPMISWAPIVNRIHRYLTTSDYASQSINLESVEIHDVETAPEKRPRTLKHLLRANHVNHAIIYHHLQYHNHMPHLLGSAYLLGADVAQLQKIYDTESKELEEWQDSPAEICDADWRDFLGDKKYQRAYVDFFEDELALKFNYDWSKVAEEYLFSGKNPLINGVIAGRTYSVVSSFRVLITNFSWPSSHTPRLRLRTLQQRSRHGSPRHVLHRLQLPPQIHRRTHLHPRIHLHHHLSS